jgi:hypothetical protein
MDDRTCVATKGAATLLALMVAGCGSAAPPAAPAAEDTVRSRASELSRPALRPTAALRWGVTGSEEERGRCLAEEAARIERREKASIGVGATVSLRRRPKTFVRGECEHAAKRFNFHYMLANERGCFVNAFDNKTDEAVTDLATGLMWQRWASDGKRWDEVPGYLASLNAARFGGHSDWRLPTVEESLSLIEIVLSGASRLDPVLFSGEKEFWTADLGPRRVPWVLDTLAAFCEAGDFRTAFSVRAVRTVAAAR